MDATLATNVKRSYAEMTLCNKNINAFSGRYTVGPQPHSIHVVPSYGVL